MSIVVFWLEGEAAVPACAHFGAQALAEALACAEAQRRAGRRHVCISTALDDQVGAPGVASVEAGRTPDGQAYDWSKAGRAGKVRRR